ncbi:MAG: AraC family transcriptional regulator [Desulfobacteraceae bacterium]|jgi:AraC-like DNA-binding protein
MGTRFDIIEEFSPSPGELNRETVLNPVCIERFRLNGNSCTGQTERKIFIEDTCITLFCMSGRISLSAVYRGKKIEHTIPAGRFCLYSCPKDRCFIRCKAEEYSKILQVLSPLSPLFNLLGENRLPPVLTGQETGGESVPLIREITIPMSGVIGLLNDSVTLNKVPDLFILSKILELLWMCFGTLHPDHDSGIDVDDHRALQRAMIILENNLESPPRLSQLANMVGMSTSKLKNIFPKAVGVPPYVYLRKKRMEKAMHLLKNGGMNVTEIAMEVGYNSFSHFTKAFSREFNVTPSRLKKSLAMKKS